MKYMVLGSVLGSMLAVTSLVNGQENGSPKNNSSAGKGDVAQLIDFLHTNGEESSFKEHIAPVIGLPGPMEAKGKTISEEHKGKDKSLRECYLVYEKSPDAAAESRRPLCIYLKKQISAGHDDETQYFRLSLTGQLEKIVKIIGKRDDNGKVIPGSGVTIDQDIKSSESKKIFAAEMTAMKKWLKAQQKVAAKTSVTSS